MMMVETSRSRSKDGTDHLNWADSKIVSNVVSLMVQQILFNQRTVMAKQRTSPGQVPSHRITSWFRFIIKKDAIWSALRYFLYTC